MGAANVINIGGLRIAGLSGIYKEKDYAKGWGAVYLGKNQVIVLYRTFRKSAVQCNDIEECLSCPGI